MKFSAASLSCSFAAMALTAMTLVEARLYHLPLGRVNNDNHFRHLATGDADADQDNLYQARGVQYADLKVGCPPQTQSAIISTASKAIGFPCSGCTNDCGEGSHLNGLYNEGLSSCFSQVSCDKCILSASGCTSSRRQCPVNMFYSEGSSFSGFEVEDNISVGGEDNNDQAFPLRFGCQTDITGLFESQIPDGIFGMNKNKGSAIMQWNNTGYLDAAAFSLCYNVRQDVNKQSGVMVLGGPDERLHETTMKFAKDVGIENYELRIKDVHLKRGSALSSSAAKNTTVNLGLAGDNTATLDSGTTCTYLNREWKDSLEDAWRQVTDGKYSMFSHLSITDAELNELPTIVFDLESTTNADESITVDYPPIRYMEKSDYGGWDFCLYASDSAATVTLGNTFMAGHDVLHDLENKRIGFAESKCEVKTIADPPGISVESDADIATPSHSNMTLLKSVVLEPEPIHKRKKDAKTPVLDTFYALLAVAFVAVVALVLYSRYRRKDMREDENIGDDFEPTVAELT